MPVKRITPDDRDPRAEQSRCLVDAIARDMQRLYGRRGAFARETIERHLGRIVAEARAGKRAGAAPHARVPRD